jgi:endonuclease/exonuclease/phosphatase (EEP) superfamily protein YafD
VLPYVETNRWFVRMADFPRLQLLMAILAAMAATAFLLRRHALAAGLALAGLGAAALAHAVTLWPYRPGGEAFLRSCPEGSSLSVLVSNVLMENRTAAPIVEAVRRERPDIFLALETDAWWDKALAPLSDSMPHHIEEIGGSYYGIHLFSRLPLEDPRIRHLAGQDVPAITSGVRLASGEVIGFIGLHPRPPHPSQPATGRDAQLYEAAFLLRESERPAVVVGDLNATPWETSIARMRRIGGLIDPRRGFGYLATYSATSWWRSWPLDHVLHEEGFATLGLERLPNVGSDHYPYLARLCRTGEAGERRPALHDDDLDEARAAIAAAREAAGGGR